MSVQDRMGRNEESQVFKMEPVKAKLIQTGVLLRRHAELGVSYEPLPDLNLWALVPLPKPPPFNMQHTDDPRFK